MNGIILKKILKYLYTPILYGFIIGIAITLLFDYHKIGNVGFVLNQMGYSMVLSLLFWIGNRLISNYLKDRYSWIKETRKILILNFGFVFSYSCLIIFLFYTYIWFILMKKKDFHGFYDQFYVGFYLCFSLTAILTLWAFSFNFLRQWKQSVIDGERLKREALMLEYESLKNQVNPHFLFNNLNALSSLIEKDKDSAILYVKKLSDVYRYVLERRNLELIPFIDELEFIDSYIYLLKIRFGEKLECVFDIQDSDFLTVPLALQLLFENAVKHNEISSERPLRIRIYDEDDQLIVENNIQAKEFISPSSQVGLKTLEFQFEYLSGKKVVIDNESDYFKVHLPKIH